MTRLVLLVLLIVAIDETLAFFRPSLGPSPPWLGRLFAVSWTNGTSVFVGTGIGEGVVVGYNDVWVSGDDGLSWAQIPSLPPTEHWSKPIGAAAVSYGGSQYIIGGRDFLTCWSPSWDSPYILMLAPSPSNWIVDTSASRNKLDNLSLA